MLCINNSFHLKKKTYLKQCEFLSLGTHLHFDSCYFELSFNISELGTVYKVGIKMHNKIEHRNSKFYLKYFAPIII